MLNKPDTIQLQTYLSTYLSAQVNFSRRAGICIQNTKIFDIELECSAVQCSVSSFLGSLLARYMWCSGVRVSALALGGGASDSAGQAEPRRLEDVGVRRRLGLRPWAGGAASR